MKILIVVAGTHGDTRPAIALGRELAESGHQVVMCAAEKDRSFIADYGLAYHDCGVDYMETINAAVEAGAGQWALFKSWVAFVRDDVNQRFVRVKEIFNKIEKPDLVIGAGMEFASSAIAEFHGVSYVHMLHIPPALRNGSLPPLFCPKYDLPKFANKLLWWINDFGYNLLVRRILNSNRETLGLPRLKSVYGHLTRKTLIAADEQLAKVPADAQSDYVQTEYCHLRDDEALDADLVKFIQAGPPPVYLGFGSMSRVSEGQAGAQLRAALAQTRHRIVLSKGWGDFTEIGSTDRVRVIGHVPHLSLFPKMAAVVHHGGAGTTHTAAWSGVPQVVVPHAFDQFFWSDRVVQLRLGPKGPAVASLTKRKLLKAIDEVLANSEYANNAQKLSLQLRKGRQTGVVTTLIERMTKGAIAHA